MLYLQIGIAVYILIMFFHLILNYRGYKEVPKSESLSKNPPVLSVVIPCKNGLSSIGNCLDSLGRQDYPHLEILVLDEESNPETLKIIQERHEEYANIRLIPIGPSPQNWSKRTYALHEGALKAQGEWLLFLDHRVVLQPPCISRCLDYSLQEKIDFLSLMPRQELRTFWEKLILPIVFGWFGTRFSLSKVNDPKSTQAVAVDQFMLIRKQAYQASGGFQKVRHEILEDSALAREIKELGLSYRLIGAKKLVTSRVYGGLKEIWQKWERVFVGEVGSSPISILYTFLIIGLTTIVPFASVLWCAYLGFDQVNPWILMICVGQCIIVLTARLILDYALRIGPLYAFLQPIGATFALAILVTSLFHTLMGSLEYAKGRVASELHK